MEAEDSGINLLALLEEERLAACAADVDRLMELQEPKAEAMRRCMQALPSEEQLAVLGERARENIRLMRHLTSVLRAMMSQDQKDTYGASGERRPSEASTLRGRA